MTRKSKIGIGLLILLVLIQFIRREKNVSSEDFSTTDFMALEQPPAAVAKILKDACYDCHSNNSKYPWYSEVAPVSWWITGHINGGKQHLNFSEWGNYPAKKAAHKLEECYEMMENGAMPLKSYTWLHSEAKLTDDQRKMMVEYFKKLEQRSPQG